MHLQQTEQFRRAAGLPVADTQTIPSISDRKLNLALLLEEVSELAEAYGMEETFCQAMFERVWGSPAFDQSRMDMLRETNPSHEYRDTQEYNPVDALDAIADIQVILDGATLTSGFQKVMPLALRAVYLSNMTKVGMSHDEAVLEAYKHSQDCEAVRSADHSGWVLRRSDDGKLLKPSTFRSPELASFIQPE